VVSGEERLSPNSKREGIRRDLRVKKRGRGPNAEKGENCSYCVKAQEKKNSVRKETPRAKGLRDS